MGFKIKIRLPVFIETIPIFNKPIREYSPIQEENVIQNYVVISGPLLSAISVCVTLTAEAKLSLLHRLPSV